MMFRQNIKLHWHPMNYNDTNFTVKVTYSSKTSNNPNISNKRPAQDDQDCCPLNFPSYYTQPLFKCNLMIQVAN